MVYTQDEDQPEGFDGNLTKEQTEKLKEAWRIYFKILKEGETDNAIGGVKADKNAADDDGSSKQRGEGKDAFKDKAKDDSAKEEQTKKREQQEASALLGSHSKEELRKAFWDGSRGETPDALMLRFLRARKWDVDRAFAMAASVGRWRLQMDVEGIKRKGEEGLCKEDGFRLQYDSGKTYIMGTDKEDRPIVYIHVAKHHVMEQTQEALQRFTIFGIESAKSLLTPKCRGQGCIIFDLNGFGLTNMDWQCLRFLIEVFEARYPETLGVLLIHKAPMAALGIWQIVKPFLDPNVREKIFFTNSAEDLEKWIDPEHLPKSMGGNMQWTWNYTGPVENENAKMKDKKRRHEAMDLWWDAVDEFEELTLKWLDGDEKAGEKRFKYGNALIMTRYFDSDPFIRGQSVYTREGTAVGDGTVRWHYPHGDETFGVSYNKIRKEYDIAGKCPENGHPDGLVAAAQHALDKAKTPDEAAALASGKAGDDDYQRIKGRASQSLSSITPGPSNADKARENAIKERERLEKDLEDAKKKEEEQKKKRQEAQKAAAEKAEQTEKDSEEQQPSMFSLGGLSSALTATAAAAASFVPAAVGGERLREYMQGESAPSSPSKDASGVGKATDEDGSDDGSLSESDNEAEKKEPRQRSSRRRRSRRDHVRPRRSLPHGGYDDTKPGIAQGEPPGAGGISSEKFLPPTDQSGPPDEEPYEASSGPGKDYDDMKRPVPVHLFSDVAKAER